MSRDAGPADGASGVPASIAAIMAAIRREVTAPAHHAGDDGPVAPAVAEPPAPRGGEAGVPPRAPADPTASAPRCAPLAIDAEARALLAPMLRDWLDANLPEIVETAVHAEIRRLTGLGVDNTGAAD